MRIVRTITMWLVKQKKKKRERKKENEQKPIDTLNLD